VTQLETSRDLVLALPYGDEPVHLRNVGPPLGRRAEDEAAALELARAWAAGGVHVEADFVHPLLRDRHGRLQVCLTHDGRRGELLNGVLVGEGLASYEEDWIWPPPLVNRSSGRPDFDVRTAQEAAKAAKAGAHGRPAPTPETVTITPAVAQEALAFAEQALRRVAGATLERAPRVVVQPVHPNGNPRAGGWATPDGTIGVRTEQPAGPGDPAGLLRLVLVHELLHLLHFERGLLPRPDGAQAHANRKNGAKVLLEGFASYWTWQVACAEGLERELDALGWEVAYAQGFSFWHALYQRLEAAGQEVSLEPGRSDLVDRLHRELLALDPATLSRPEGSLYALEDLFEPEAWLREHVPGWPEPPLKLSAELTSDRRGRPVVEGRLEPVGATQLFLPGRTAIAQLRVRPAGEGQPLGAGLPADDTHSGAYLPADLLLEPGHAQAVRARLPSARYLPKGPLEARLEVRGLIVAWTPGGEPVHYGGAFGPWIPLDAPSGD
jgi:hypothetical protein